MSAHCEVMETVHLILGQIKYSCCNYCWGIPINLSSAEGQCGQVISEYREPIKLKLWNGTQNLISISCNGKLTSSAFRFAILTIYCIVHELIKVLFEIIAGGLTFITVECYIGC